MENSAELEQQHAIVLEETATEANVEGCRYRPRCPLGFNELCHEVEPGLDLVGPGHRAACHYPQSKEELQAAVSARAAATSAGLTGAT